MEKKGKGNCSSFTPSYIVVIIYFLFRAMFLPLPSLLVSKEKRQFAKYFLEINKAINKAAVALFHCLFKLNDDHVITSIDLLLR